MSLGGSDLRLRDVSAGYSRGVPVLNGVDLHVAPGEVVGLVGANGAGKTTIMRVITGQLRQWTGDVELDGELLVSRLSPARRNTKGVVLVPEGHEILSSLSVIDNLRLGALPFWPGRSRARLDEALPDIYEIFPVLRDRGSQQAGTLSGGEQQQLAIARAMIAGPRVLLLDEPSLGLAPIIVERIYESLAALKARGLSILLVEQQSDVARGLSDRLCVMRLGEIVMEGDPRRLTSGQLRSAYFGE